MWIAYIRCLTFVTIVCSCANYWTCSTYQVSFVAPLLHYFGVKSIQRFSKLVVDFCFHVQYTCDLWVDMIEVTWHYPCLWYTWIDMTLAVYVVYEVLDPLWHFVYCVLMCGSETFWYVILLLKVLYKRLYVLKESTRFHVLILYFCS